MSLRLRTFASIPTGDDTGQQVTGLCDRSGSFGLSLTTGSSALGWNVSLVFSLLVPVGQRAVVDDLVSFFGVGHVYVSGRNATFRVASIADMLVLLKHFDLYPLMSPAVGSFALWAEAVKLVAAGLHLTPAGLDRLKQISAALGRGPSKDLSKVEPNLVPAVRPPYVVPLSLSPWWVSGYLTVYASFSAWAALEKSPWGKWGYSAYRWKHHFSVSFPVTAQGVAVATLIADMLGADLYLRAAGDRVDVMAQSDLACASVAAFLAKYPLQASVPRLCW